MLGSAAVSDASAAVSDVSGATSDAFGAVSDAFGAVSDASGAVSDASGAVSDASAAVSDAFGAASVTPGAEPALSPDGTGGGAPATRASRSSDAHAGERVIARPAKIGPAEHMNLTMRFFMTRFSAWQRRICPPENASVPNRLHFRKY
jgi:hypothetical protein